MGIYINPTAMSKEQWLELHGTVVTRLRNKQDQVVVTEPAWAEFRRDHLPVVLIDNGQFTAAGICYSPREYAAFTDPLDKRPRVVFSVPIEDLRRVTGLGDTLERSEQ